MSHKATRMTVVGFDLIQLAGAVLLALVVTFVGLGGYEFVRALELSFSVSAAALGVATLVFTLLLVATVLASRRLRPGPRRRQLPR